ncbi:DUF2490 domain-containing protein [Flavobacterium zhairuonense]|uniref:DUF2490 domain-containing protein n=1 Tax=Flavobacterium zhairuonense TaxID=2493631 RepID=UPI0010529585|nr:DUF2490 domain-containing protein [Flavobacterium zhairuonense]KAF2516948.1 DUF2490 domain-containing protein [Flavobacterium zhairuonense]
MKNNFTWIFILLFPIAVLGQTGQKKEINQQLQTWVSINSVTKFADHWGIIGDFHIRRNDFVSDPSFYFIRGGISYIPNSNVSINAGYAHMWLAPSNPDWSTFADENRIYQQAQLNTKMGNVSILQRLRNEQRWQEKIVDDKPSGDWRFTNRIRYLASFTFRISDNKSWPSMVLSDEILLHFGEEVVYNTFDQNRFFIGIKKTINPKWSYDFGYMNVYQQKYSGYQYDMNHTIRLFFYLNTSIRKKVPSTTENSGDE